METTEVKPSRYVRLLAVRYTVESDGRDSWPEYDETDERGFAVPYVDEIVDCSTLTLEEVAEVIERHGCTTSEGAHWFYSPDGSYDVDLGTGMQEEPSAHPEGFSADERGTIQAILDRR